MALYANGHFLIAKDANRASLNNLTSCDYRRISQKECLSIKKMFSWTVSIESSLLLFTF